jgi:uroporphyrinogen-III synthase
MSADKRYKILSTKAIPADLLQTAASQGLDITVQSFITIQPVLDEATKQRVHELLQQNITAVFTSSNAVKIIRQDYLEAHEYYGPWMSVAPNTTQEEIAAYRARAFFTPGWDVYCLEGATQKTLKSHWVDDNMMEPAEHLLYKLKGTASDATKLAEEIIAQNQTKQVVFFCGNKRRGELPTLLRQHGIEVEEVVVYETTEVPVLADNHYDGMLFFSPSGVSSFFTVNRLSQNTVCFSIGNTTSKALEDFTDNKIIVSPSPLLSELVQTAIFYFNNINCYE